MVIGYPIFNTTKESIFDARRRARNRALICPGAGLAALGYCKGGAVTFALFVGVLLAATWFVYDPSPALFWWVLVTFFLAVFVWFGELLLAHGDSIDVAPQSTPSPTWHRVGAAILGSLLVGLIVQALLSFSVFTVGPEMWPTLRHGKRLLVHHRVDDSKLAAGKLILFRLSQGNQIAEPGRLTIGRILAQPGDRLSLRDGTYYVNGAVHRRAAALGEHFTDVAVAEFPASTEVPPNCFFISQDSESEGRDSMVLSWAKKSHIVSTELFDLLPSRLLEPVEENR